jgi:hypothetical protein
MNDLYKYAWLIAVIIIIGLVLRFGRTSHYLVKDVSQGLNSLVSTLSLQKFPGNTP